MNLYNSIRLIAVDLDGTLLNEEKKLSARTQQALQAAAKRGIEIVIATGRPLTAIPEELIGMDCIRYVVSVDGARIQDLKTGELIYEGLIPRELVKPIYDVFDSLDCVEEIYLSGRGYVSQWGYDHADEYTMSHWSADYLRRTRRVVEDIHTMMDRPIEKAHALFKTLEEREEAIRLLSRIEGIVLCDAFLINLEVSAAGNDKGHALRILGEKLAISRDEMIAFGDSNNDRRMLEEVGTAVVMGNAAEDLKKLADIIAPDNSEDGVAAVIEDLLEVM